MCTIYATPSSRSSTAQQKPHPCTPCFSPHPGPSPTPAPSLTLEAEKVGAKSLVWHGSLTACVLVMGHSMPVLTLVWGTQCLRTLAWGTRCLHSGNGSLKACLLLTSSSFAASDVLLPRFETSVFDCVQYCSSYTTVDSFS